MTSCGRHIRWPGWCGAFGRDSAEGSVQRCQRLRDRGVRSRPPAASMSSRQRRRPVSCSSSGGSARLAWPLRAWSRCEGVSFRWRPWRSAPDSNTHRGRMPEVPASVLLRVAAEPRAACTEGRPRLRARPPHRAGARRIASRLPQPLRLTGRRRLAATGVLELLVRSEEFIVGTAIERHPHILAFPDPEISVICSPRRTSGRRSASPIVSLG